jgi:hypothetical protein
MSYIPNPLPLLVPTKYLSERGVVQLFAYRPIWLKGEIDSGDFGGRDCITQPKIAAKDSCANVSRRGSC